MDATGLAEGGQQEGTVSSLRIFDIWMALCGHVDTHAACSPQMANAYVLWISDHSSVAWRQWIKQLNLTAGHWARGNTFWPKSEHTQTHTRTHRTVKGLRQPRNVYFTSQEGTGHNLLGTHTKHIVTATAIDTHTLTRAHTYTQRYAAANLGINNDACEHRQRQGDKLIWSVYKKGAVATPTCTTHRQTKGIYDLLHINFRKAEWIEETR